MQQRNYSSRYSCRERLFHHQRLFNH